MDSIDQNREISGLKIEAGLREKTPNQALPPVCSFGKHQTLELAISFTITSIMAMIGISALISFRVGNKSLQLLNAFSTIMGCVVIIVMDILRMMG